MDEGEYLGADPLRGSIDEVFEAGDMAMGVSEGNEFVMREESFCKKRIPTRTPSRDAGLKERWGWVLVQIGKSDVYECGLEKRWNAWTV